MCEKSGVTLESRLSDVGMHETRQEANESAKGDFGIEATSYSAVGYAANQNRQPPPTDLKNVGRLVHWPQASTPRYNDYQDIRAKYGCLP